MPSSDHSKSKAPRKGHWKEHALQELHAAQRKVFAENERQGFSLKVWKKRPPKNQPNK